MRVLWTWIRMIRSLHFHGDLYSRVRGIIRSPIRHALSASFFSFSLISPDGLRVYFGIQ
ncbi:hypothetical protein MA16_Dca019509 [Dendrobium catenatum]|uniref:Uncharacterized protein n=1 Tax=Dendrobium catenatum TaxID=906689 RepID=A0A2I0XJJ1_9ASPA|nr:hypothetical protein MA16_Dca019509 [Dendrobium catenatum]